jgi:hypothetical protein
VAAEQVLHQAIGILFFIHVQKDDATNIIGSPGIAGKLINY